MRLVHANSSGLTTFQGENAVSPVKNGGQNGNKKRESHFCNSLILKWCHRESNQGHKDFQSFALPTEL